MPILNLKRLRLILLGAAFVTPATGEEAPGDVGPARADSSAFAPANLANRALPQKYVAWRRPAANDVRPASDFADTFANDAADAIFFAPGVQANIQDLNEPRLVLRGFHVGSRQDRSGPAVYRDGAPLTDVHGATNLQEVDLLSVSRVEIHRGGAGDARLSGGTLAGAVDFVSPTGRDLPAGRTIRADVGSTVEGKVIGRAHADLAAVSRGGDVDYYASATGVYDTGARDNNQRNSVIVNANIGYVPSSSFSTRMFVEVMDNDVELAGGQTPDAAEGNPVGAAPPIGLPPLFPGGPTILIANGAEDDEWARDILSARLSNRTNFRLFSHDFEGGFHYTYRNVESPQVDFVGVIEEAGGEWGTHFAGGGEARLYGYSLDYRIGVAYASGERSSDRFENLSGEAGGVLSETDQLSTNLNIFAEAGIEVLPRLRAESGVQFISVDRELTVDDDDDSEEVSFSGVAGRAGLIYDASENVQMFGNISRVFEAPTFYDLTANTPVALAELEEQDGFGYEAGLRGRRNDWLGWDFTYYSVSVDNEIITVDDPEANGLGETVLNVDETEHKGFEAGVDVSLFPQRFSRAGRMLTLRSVYAYNDVRFVDASSIDDDLDGNRLAGVPQHLYRGELRYAAPERWFLAANMRMTAGDYFADHVNETSISNTPIIGFSAGLSAGERLQIFASGENLTDEEYPAGVTPVLAQADQEGRIYTPAARVSVFGGLRYSF
ncbi:MAG: TonB-dependent receptor [Pseudomonadota bacterium]